MKGEMIKELGKSTMDKLDKELGINSSLQNVIWRCNQSLRDDNGSRVFTNQSEYSQIDKIDEDTIVLIDDRGNRTEVFKCWFTSI